MRFFMVLLLFICSSFQQAPIDALTFPSYNGKNFSSSSLKDKKAVVFVFLMPDCPFGQKYTKTLNEISKMYESKGIQFEGVISGDLYTDKEVKEYIKDFKVSFPLLYDKHKKLATYYGIKVSPSVVVSDCSGKALYKGLIDNWPVSPGKTRQFISENYLKDVLNALVANKTVTTKNTEAVGCILE